MAASTQPPPDTVAQLFVQRCRQHADRIFIVTAEREHCFAELFDDAQAIARRLHSRGAQRGQHVAVLLPQGANLVSALFGALLADCLPVLIDPRLVPAEVAFLRKHCRCELTLSCAALDDAKSHAALIDVEETLAQPSWRAGSLALSQQRNEDVAVVLPTSGSTAAPKAVQLHHRGLLANLRAFNQRYEICADDVMIGTLSFFHSFGLTAWLLAALDAAATIALVDDPLPGRVAELAARSEASVLLAVSSYYSYLLRSPSCCARQLASLRLSISGACRLSPALAEAFQDELGQAIHQTYGLTEASPVVTANPLQDNRLGTVGTALAGVQLQLRAAELRDTQLREAELSEPNIRHEGSIGELWLRGDNVMRGYLDNPQASAACLDEAGWLGTGDLARIDRDGYLSLVGRAKNLIVRAGNKIYPEEIEEVLCSHPLIEDAAAFALPDPHCEQVPMAFVVAAAGAAPDGAEILEYCRQRLAAFKLPRQLRLVEALPRNPNGKLRRQALRAQLERAQVGREGPQKK